MPTAVSERRTKSRGTGRRPSRGRPLEVCAIRVGSTSANAYLSDFAVVGVAVAGFVAGVRKGFARLRHARWIWGTAFSFLIWTVAGLAIGRHVSSAYPVYTHAATAAKFTEYALLAPALPLVLRTVADLATVLWSLTAWSVF